MSDIYEKVYQRSIDDPDGFWADAARDLHWEREWDDVLDRRIRRAIGGSRARNLILVITRLIATCSRGAPSKPR